MTPANRRPLLIASLAFAGTLAVGGGAQLVAEARASVAMNSPAPEFSLAARGGGQVSLSQYRGQVVMINFWASWCGPCRQEMPLLDAMYKKYKPMGFTMLGVNVEPDAKLAEGFLKTTPVSFPIAYDPDSRISKLYNVMGMPSTVIVDRKGRARVLHKGYRPGDENAYLDHIRKLLRE